MPNEWSHTQILAWSATFFFIAGGFYGLVFRLVFKNTVKKLEKCVQEVHADLSQLKKEELVIIKADIEELDEKKVEVKLYREDKEEGQKLITKLQTVEACTLMQRACVASLIPQLSNIQHSVQSILDNQVEGAQSRGELSEKVASLIKRVDHQIERIDGHLNGHGHKD